MRAKPTPTPSLHLQVTLRDRRPERRRTSPNRECHTLLRQMKLVILSFHGRSLTPVPSRTAVTPGVLVDEGGSIPGWLVSLHWEKGLTGIREYGVPCSPPSC